MKIIGLGAGLANCMLGYWLIKQGHEVVLIDKNCRPGGMCRTFYYEDLTYEYGPHILYTNEKEVVDFFSEFVGFVKNEFYLSTQVENTTLTYPPYLEEVAQLPSGNIILQELKNLPQNADETNFETFLISCVGRKAYNLFFEEFTKKFWDIHPSKLSANWAKTRELRLKTNADKKAFSAKYQGYPVTDYTELIKVLVDKIPIIRGNIIGFDNGVILDTQEKIQGDFYINSIPLDELFNKEFGELDFAGFNLQLDIYNQEYELPIHQTGNKTAWMYFPSQDVPYTRKCEYKTITQKKNNRTLVGTEIPMKGIKLYPFYDIANESRFNQYLDKACNLGNFMTVGRMGLFIYTTMGNTYMMMKSALTQIDKWSSYTNKERCNILLDIRKLADKGA